MLHTTINGFINELRQEQHTVKIASDDIDTGALLAEFKIDNWDEITARIEESDLYIDAEQPRLFGVEEDPHVSILVGLDDGQFPLGKLTAWLATQYGFKMDLTGISTFKNKDYEVVKFDVRAPELVVMHDYVAANFPNNEHFPEYIPHMTIAYVKPGCGDKYVQKLREVITLEAKSFVYSDSNRKKTRVKPVDTSSKSWMVK